LGHTAQVFEVNAEADGDEQIKQTPPESPALSGSGIVPKFP